MAHPPGGERRPSLIGSGTLRTIGFAGTAKNAGKTTTTLYVLDLLAQAAIPTALTSIGYDGENKDNVTGLPKPRFLLQPGMLVATAEGCLKAGSAAIRILERSGIQTVLGEIVIGVVEQAGTVLVAGPNRRSDLKLLFARLAERGAALTLVDGALNRLVPMVCTDGLVLSTGASYSEDIDVITNHAAALMELMQPPQAGTPLPADKGIQIRRDSQPPFSLQPGSLLGEKSLMALQAALSAPVAELLIPGVCDPLRLETLLDGGALNGATLTFGSPLKLIASGDPLTWRRVFARAAQLDVHIRYLEKTPVFFLTVNPFYPRYLLQVGEYEPAYVDRLALLATARARIHGVPVIDILQPPVPDLLSLMEIPH